MRAKRLYSVTVRGRRSEWAFDQWALPEQAAAWRSDGLDVAEVVQRIPAWAVESGLADAWRYVSDIFNFRNPFRRDR